MYKSPNLTLLDEPLKTRDVANKIDESLWVYMEVIKQQQWTMKRGTRTRQSSTTNTGTRVNRSQQDHSPKYRSMSL